MTNLSLSVHNPETMRVVDFHCDLLWYLSNGKERTEMDPEAQSSVPQLVKGGVEIQTLPIYTATGSESVTKGERQFEIYCDLKLPIKTRVAIENASSFCSEDETLDNGLKRLERWHAKHPIAYISLTWNGENRFGGGAGSTAGLKDDGKELVKWMSKNKIAVDLSHASDRLGEEIVKQDVNVIASHSNFREVCNHVRNLPDHLAKAIGDKGGLIGLNMVRHFIGNAPIEIVRHIEHAKKLGIENHLCLGTDFFGEIDVEKEKEHLKPYFFEGFSTSECYPEIRKILRAAFSDEFVNALMYDRLLQFLER